MSVLIVIYVTSIARSFRDRIPILSLAKDVKLGFYTVPTGNRAPDRRVAVHHSYYCRTGPGNNTHRPICSPKNLTLYWVRYFGLA